MGCPRGATIASAALLYLAYYLRCCVKDLAVRSPAVGALAANRMPAYLYRSNNDTKLLAHLARAGLLRGEWRTCPARKTISGLLEALRCLCTPDAARDAIDAARSVADLQREPELEVHQQRGRAAPALQPRPPAPGRAGRAFRNQPRRLVATVRLCAELGDLVSNLG